MIVFNKDNRLEIENEYLALLINKPELIDRVQVLPKYLHNEENKKIMEKLIECYSKYRTLNSAKLYEEDENFNLEKFIELATDTFYYQHAYEKQLEESEKAIIDFYKEDIINNLSNKLKNNEIKYSDYVNKIKKLDDIQLVYETNKLTMEEIQENLSGSALIKFKKYKKLNDILKFVQGDFLIIGATTGGGKSGFLLNLMEDLMDDYQCIYFNMEMSKQTIYSRLISIRGGLAVNEVINPNDEFQKDLVNVTINSLPFENIIIEHKANDIKQISNVIAKNKKDNKHTIIFIDHLGLTKSDQAKSLYEQATDVAKRLRQICLDYDCTIIGASQLNRNAYSSDEISLSMLKDSGELENSASKVMLIHKQEEPTKAITKVDIQIAKNRDGKNGFVKMQYNKLKQIFSEIDDY